MACMGLSYPTQPKGVRDDPDHSRRIDRADLPRGLSPGARQNLVGIRLSISSIEPTREGKVMVKNYFIVAIRYLMRHKGYTCINLFGLGLGIACCLLMALFVKHEWAYDRFHENEDELFRVVKQRLLPNGEAVAFGSFDALYPPWVVNALKDDIPDVRSASRFMRATGRITVEKNTFRRSVGFVDLDFFQMFTFPFLAGDPATALARPDGMVLTASLARQIFGHADENYSAIIGRSVALQKKPFVVTGVMADVPATSSLQFDLLVLSESAESLAGFRGLATMGYATGYVRYGSLYLQIGKGQVPSMLEKLNRWEEKGRLRDDDFRLLLQPLRDVYSNAEIPNLYEPKGNQTGVYILGGIGWVVLLIACSNFVSLSVAASSGRIREVGLRKVLGASRSQIARQFWSETLLLSVLGLGLGLVLAELFLPAFNGFVQRDLKIPYFDDGAFSLLLVGILVFVGLVAGGYPAVMLSRFQPASIMQGGGKLGGQNRLTRLLIVLQYAASVVLLVCTGIIVLQQNYMKNKDLGYNEEQILIIGGPGGNRELIQRYKREILRDPRIVGVAISDRTFTNGWSSWRCHLSDGSTVETRILKVDADYLSTLEIALLEGRNFSQDRARDRDQAVLINETLAKRLGTQGAVGQILNIEGGSLKDPVIIGIVGDFHTDALYKPIQPVVLLMHQLNTQVAFFVRIRSDQLSETLAMLEETWKAIMPSRRFQLSFLDRNLHRQYEREDRWREIVSYSALFAIFISCLGLFGLASLAVVQRTKEIGVRKVLGASESYLVWLLSKDFAKLLLLANAIAWPMAYWIMDEWLTTTFAYHMDLGIGVFVLVGALTYSIAQLTILGHILKVIRQSPIRALRYE